ncbi:MAG: hypothetical protein AB7U20_20895 [Planctomycetaceae bacterium]
MSVAITDRLISRPNSDVLKPSIACLFLSVLRLNAGDPTPVPSGPSAVCVQMLKRSAPI